VIVVFDIISQVKQKGDWVHFLSFSPETPRVQGILARPGVLYALALR